MSSLRTAMFATFPVLVALAPSAHAAPLEESAPISSSSMVSAAALDLAGMLGLSVVSTDALFSARLHRYDVYTFDRYLRPGSADVSSWMGVVLMPDVGRDIVSVKHAGRFLGYMYRHGGSLSQLLVNDDRAVFGVGTVGADGSLGASLDLDGDGVVDFSDMIRADGTHVTFVQRGLGAAFADAWLAGTNPLCLRAPTAVEGRPLTTLADPRTMLDACPAHDIDTAAPAGGTGPLAGSPTRRTLDPLSQMCAPYDERMRPGYFSGGTYEGDGVSTESVIAATVATLASRSFVRWISVPLNVHGTMTSAEVAAAASTRLAQWNALGAFLAITLTPSTAHSVPCEEGPPGACAEEAARARAELAEEDAPDESPEPVPDSSPEPPPTDGGTEERPEGASESEALARYCTATADGRQEWQKALDEARNNGFAPTCENPAADSTKYTGNLYCDTLRRLYDIQAFDAAKELANPTRCDYDKSICVSDPTDHIQGKFAELFRMIDGLTGFVCNPLVCDPELFSIKQ